MNKRIAICFFTLLPLLVLFGVVSADFSHFSDEFNNTSSLSDWTALASNSTTATTIDVDTSEVGKLVMVPAVFSQNGWYADSVGPYLYKMIEGDFVVTSHIVAGNVNDHDAPPTGGFNSAGYVVRDPASTPGSQNWVMYNHGYQRNSSGLATELKTTVNSNSVLELASVGTHIGQLALCRSGDEFYAFRMMEGQSEWTQEATVLTRPDFPAAVQVGPVVNGWTNADLRAQFDYVRVYTGTVTDSADCLTQLTTPTAVSVSAVSAESESASFGRIMLIGLCTILTIFWIIRRKAVI